MFFFRFRLDGHWRKWQDPEPDPDPNPDPLARGADPDPYQNVTDPQHCPILVWAVYTVLSKYLTIRL